MAEDTTQLDSVDSGSQSSEVDSSDKMSALKADLDKSIEVRQGLKSELRQVKSELDQLRKQAEAARSEEAKKAAEAGDFKALYEDLLQKTKELEPLAQKGARLEAQLTEQLGSKIQALPKKLQKMFTEDMSLEQKSTVYSGLSEYIQTEKPSPPPAAPPSSSGFDPAKVAGLPAAERRAKLAEIARDPVKKRAFSSWVKDLRGY